MLGVEDAIRRHPLTALGLAAITATALIPRARRGPWAKGVRAVAELCVEAEGEAEAGIVERLAEGAIDDLTQAMAHGEPEARHAAVHAVVRRFKRRAHRRSKRFARDDAGRRRRYVRQIAALETRVSQRQATASDAQKQGFERVLQALQAPPAG